MVSQRGHEGQHLLDNAEQYTADELANFRDQLDYIHDAARRKRLAGYPDAALELGISILEKRLARMEKRT